MDAIDERIYEQVLKIGGVEYRIGDLFSVSMENINEEFSTQAGRLAYLGMLMAQAEAAYNEAKLYGEELYAKVDLIVRDDYDKAGKKYTEAMIKSKVLSTGEYVEALMAENEASYQFRMLKALVDAMRQRGDMLVSLGAQLRQEWEATDLNIKQMSDRLRGSARR